MNALIPEIGYWLQVRDGDRRVSEIYRRHYSAHRYADGRQQNLFNRARHLVMGPGEKMVLLGADSRAIFGWRKFIDDSGQTGINCAFFRNEGHELSSVLILEAEILAARRWPGERLYTYVNPQKVKSNNPGYCFLRADWRRCGATKGGLIVLEKHVR